MGDKKSVEEEALIPADVNVEALGKCTKCDCKSFIQVGGKIRCGRKTCKHTYQQHSD